jgi:hypothetical protein
MDGFSPETYCGRYCGACSIAMCGKTGLTDEFAACFGSVPKEDLSCGGCKSENLYYGCRICILRSCTREKGVGYCIDCPDYPCKNYRKWQGAAKFLPHIHEAEASLDAIKCDGVDRWLDSQKKEWSCPSCGTPFSWYASICSKCGSSLVSKAFKLSGWSKFLCRFVLPMVCRKGKAKCTSV